MAARVFGSWGIQPCFQTVDRDLTRPRKKAAMTKMQAHAQFSLLKMLNREIRASLRSGICWSGRPRRHRACQNEVVAGLRQRELSVEQISRIGMDTSKHIFQL